MYVMSKKEAKAIDTYTIDNIGIPSIVLMENAAQEVVNKINKLEGDFLILCGTGNNGADGLAIGRKLLLLGRRVKIFIIDKNNKYTDEFNINYKILKNMNEEIFKIKNENDIKFLRSDIKNYDICVDCIFGIGLNKELDSFYKEIVMTINNNAKKIISIDIPSGLDCDNGDALGIAVKANTTYTFEVMKKGFLNYKALDYVGTIEVIKIGIPSLVKELKDEKIYILNKETYKGLLKKRTLYGHKGTYGKVLIFAGSLGFTGAASIVVKACVKSGAGTTTLVIPKECASLLPNINKEAMVITYDDKEVLKNNIKKATAIAFGPGLGKETYFENILERLIKETDITLVIDAEGINILAKRKDLLAKLKGRLILTPHPGEMSKLIEKSIDEIEEDRINIAKKFAKENNCILLLKGYNTVITNGEKVFINKTGNSKMASGGMGDGLTGLITSLLAQGHNPITATLISAYVHGLAGEEEGKEKYSVTISDLLNKVPYILNNL